MSHGATLKDVAALSGVSTATASLVLNNREVRVSGETRERIIRSARRMHYRPNQFARNLVSGKTADIALIVPTIEDLRFTALIKNLQRECLNDGYALIVHVSDNQRLRESIEMRRISGLSPEGLFLVASGESVNREQELYEDVRKVSCPVILVDHLFAETWCDGIAYDDYTGGRIAAEYLLQDTCGCIGCIFKGRSDCRRGFIDALGVLSIDMARVHLAEGIHTFEGGYAVANALIDANVTTVFCESDLAAAGFMERAAERNLDIPKDVSIMGFGNMLERSGIYRPITSVSLDTNELAVKGWNMMRARIMEARSAATRTYRHVDSQPPKTELLLPRIRNHGSVLSEWVDSHTLLS